MVPDEGTEDVPNGEDTPKVKKKQRDLKTL